MTLEEFMHLIEDDHFPKGDIIVRIFLRYDFEKDYRETYQVLMYDGNNDCYEWLNDWYEGEDDYYISQFDFVDGIFLSLSPDDIPDMIKYNKSHC